MHKLLAAVLAAASCVPVARAQDRAVAHQATGTIFTLDDAVAAAGGSAPALDAAQAGIAAAQAARTIAGLRPNLQLQTQVENILGSGPNRAVDQAETTVGLNVPIELGGKRSARIAVAQAQTDRAKLIAAIAGADARFRCYGLR